MGLMSQIIHFRETENVFSEVMLWKVHVLSDCHRNIDNKCSFKGNFYLKRSKRDSRRKHIYVRSHNNEINLHA
jgi:hypothetical protein